MKRIILSLLVFGGLGVITGCSGGKTATLEETPQASRTTGNVPPAIATSSDRFDLGGPCLPPGQYRPLALTGRQEDEVRRTGNWDALVEGAKQDVRSDCQIPYRWEKLFTALVGARRYPEALQVLTGMVMRQSPMPHAVLSRADSAFLTSTEFKESALGVEYAAVENQIQTNTRLAEAKLMSMPPNNRPPSPYRAAGACPFECCTYREWKTRSAVQLVASIRSGTVVAQLPADTAVEGVTGEVLVEPQPYAVLWDSAP